jgi:pimeloyl-ACP methyl ester carboxylesterase
MSIESRTFDGQFYDAGDAAIYYKIEGRGTPLILLHGYALNGLMWEYQRPVFSKSHTVITVDLRGFGKSSCPSGTGLLTGGRNWSSDVMADDIIGLIKAVNLEDVTVLGFSMSGPVAVRVAYQIPETVTKLILTSAILPSRGLPGANNAEVKLDLKEMDILKSGSVEAWADYIGMWHGPLVDSMFAKNPSVTTLWKKIISRHNPDYLFSMMEARLASESNIDWRSRLKEIKQKTLVIAGSLDKNFIAASRHLAEDIPNSQLMIIEDAGHMVNLEKPDEFNSAVLGFLGM